MKNPEDHAMDILKEYPGISMMDLALRVILRVQVMPQVSQVLQEQSSALIAKPSPTTEDIL